MRILKRGIAAMSEGTPGDGLLDYAVREYRRLFDEAGSKVSHGTREATSDGLLIKPVPAMYPVDCSQ
jgi:hypothetical protein